MVKNMAEVTAFGKILRKMRIDSSEVLGAMAKRLGVSAAYLLPSKMEGARFQTRWWQRLLLRTVWGRRR
jgi:energy-converting hydrogenase A subunit M